MPRSTDVRYDVAPDVISDVISDVINDVTNDVITEGVAAAAVVAAFIGIGANLGDAWAALDAAVVALANLPATRLTVVSSVYRTAPVDASGPDYLNAVVRLETRLSPAELLDALLHIEHLQGRERSYRNAPRTLDLDLLLHGDHLLATNRLTVPHPRLHQRAFVLFPLAEIEPGLQIPRHGPVASLLAAVANQRIERIGAPLTLKADGGSLPLAVARVESALPAHR